MLNIYTWTGDGVGDDVVGDDVVGDDGVGVGDGVGVDDWAFGA